MELNMKKEWNVFSPSGEDCPKRLSEKTRILAKRYLSGEIWHTMKSVSEIDGGLKIPMNFYLAMPSKAKLYAKAIRMIAQKAPLRILPGEKLVGAATLKEAMYHRIPILMEESISHTTLDFEHVLAVGYDGVKKQINSRLQRGSLNVDQVTLLESMLSCIDSAAIWKNRYLQELKAKGNNEIVESLKNIPDNPPVNFREAVQALWLLFDFQRLCGNWSGIGRIDKILGPFLKQDLAADKIDINEARELIAHFWIKGCEWINGNSRGGTGDAQFYQNIVLAGIDENGCEVANEVTDLILDVVEELHISEFPIAVRLSAKTDERLLKRIAAIQGRGGGIIAVYNEDRIIPMLVKFGYPLKEARNFANDGCWEILIPGKTNFRYQPFDMLTILQETLCLNDGNESMPKFPTFDSLYKDFKERLAFKLSTTINEYLAPVTKVTVLVDLMIEGCIEKARSYRNFGAKYSVVSPHPGGVPDVANSLLVIKKMVYDDCKLSLTELIEILRNDWKGHEELRRKIKENFDFYGNDSVEADGMLQKVFNDFTEFVALVPVRNGMLRPAGISTFGRELSLFLHDRTASAAGTKKGDILALNFSPSPGTDKRGPTAVIKSHCSVDFSKLPCGTALELKMSPSSVKGEKGMESLVGLMKTFITLGGIFMQIDAVDNDMLRDAQLHPDKYPNLSVRVAGWSARFATLSEQWQELIINRSEQKL